MEDSCASIEPDFFRILLHGFVGFNAGSWGGKSITRYYGCVGLARV